MVDHFVTRKQLSSGLRLLTGEPHVLRLIDTTAEVIEVEDALFRLDSSVLLPEGEAPASLAPGEQHEAIRSTGIVAKLLTYVNNNPKKRVLIAGHADTSGSQEHNLKLSELRAKVVLACALGDRATFVEICNARHGVADYKQILSWIAAEFDFGCDPGSIDEVEATGVQPIRNFEADYNASDKFGDASAPALLNTGAMGPKNWGAFFDAYEAALRKELAVDIPGLAQLRSKLKFVDDAQRAVGCGEHHPIESAGLDGLRSQTNRRVEIMLFDFRAELPKLDCHAGGSCSPALCEIYTLKRFKRRPLPLTGIAPEGATPLVGARLLPAFGRNKTFVYPRALAQLELVAQRMAADFSLNAIVVGHTEQLDDTTHEKTLALNRARTVVALLTRDRDYFLERFTAADPIAPWSWEEIQWMLFAIKTGEEPCYLGAVDGQRGEATIDALQRLKLDAGRVPTPFCDQATLELIVDRFLASLTAPSVAADRLRAIGAGVTQPVISFGPNTDPNAIPESSQLVGPEGVEEPTDERRRRVDLFLGTAPIVPAAVNDPKSQYAAWCASTVEELNVPVPSGLVVRVVDSHRLPLGNRSVQLLQAGVRVGTFTSSAAGVVRLEAEPGFYALQVEDGDARDSLPIVIEPFAPQGGTMVYAGFAQRRSGTPEIV